MLFRSDVKIYFWPSKYGGIGELKESDILLRDRMVWIELVQKGKPSLIDPLFDRVLKEVSYGNQKARIFVGGSRVFLILKRAQPFIEEFERQSLK